jgi:hypothetical protein
MTRIQRPPPDRAQGRSAEDSQGAAGQRQAVAPANSPNLPVRQGRQAATTAPPRTLPPETWSRVADQLDAPDLVSLALANREFNRLLQPHLNSERLANAAMGIGTLEGAQALLGTPDTPGTILGICYSKQLKPIEKLFNNLMSPINDMPAHDRSTLFNRLADAVADLPAHLQAWPYRRLTRACEEPRAIVGAADRLAEIARGNPALAQVDQPAP